jgi:hypothetical protein
VIKDPVSNIGQLGQLDSFAGGEDASDTNGHSFHPRGVLCVFRNAMWCQATHLSQQLGRLLVVEFDFGQQSVKLTVFGITKACNEFSLERRILILCWWIPYAVGYLGKDARFVDVESIFIRVDFVNVKSSFLLCEPETRVVFPKWREP